jgi:outer membrane protein assembly factor BamB
MFGARPTCALGGLALAALPFLLGAPAGPAKAKNDWPVFRGNPTQTGVATSTLPAKLAVLWKFQTGDAIEAAVAVAGGTVYLGSLDENLYAIDLAKGTEKWKLKLGPIKAAPAYADGVVYVGDLDGFFSAVDVATKARLWKYETGSETSAPNFSGNDILFGCHDEHLYCLTKQGKRRWRFKTDGPIYGAPAVADGKTFLVGCDSQLHVIDIKSGKEERAVDLGGQTGAAAAVLGDRLYVGTMRNEVKAIAWQKGEEAWAFRPRAAQAFFSSAAVTDKYVVIGSRDNKVYGIHRDSGKEAWHFATGNRVDSSPVIAGDRAVVGSMDGKLYVLGLKDGKLLQAVKLDGPVVASPVVVGGRVLIGTQKGTLYCLGAKK